MIKLTKNKHYMFITIIKINKHLDRMRTAGYIQNKNYFNTSSAKIT